MIGQQISHYKVTAKLGAGALSLLCFALLLASAVPAAAQTKARVPSVADLAWMSGDWQTAPGLMQIDEHWSHAAGDSMIGMSRTVDNGRTVFFEYLRIEARADGIYYVAHPRARPGTDFKLVRWSKQEAVFENLQHDFPKRIIYRKNRDGSLTARVDGGADSPKAEEFHFKPVNR